MRCYLTNWLRLRAWAHPSALPYPTIRTAEPSLGTGGGPWVRIPFTNWHASGQITLHNILHYNNKHGRIGWPRGDQMY